MTFCVLQKGDGWSFIKVGDLICMSEPTTLEEAYYPAKEIAKKQHCELVIQHKEQCDELVTQERRGNTILSFNENSKDRYVPVNDKRYFAIKCDESGKISYP